jgi:hypothetical protein
MARSRHGEQRVSHDRQTRDRAALLRSSAGCPPTRSCAPQVLIAGGGVAGLETLLALRTLAGDRVDITLVTPELRFVNRSMAVTRPFGPPGRAWRQDAGRHGPMRRPLASRKHRVRRGRTAGRRHARWLRAAYDVLIFTCSPSPPSNVSCSGCNPPRDHITSAHGTSRPPGGGGPQAATRSDHVRPPSLETLTSFVCNATYRSSPSDANAAGCPSISPTRSIR